MDVTTILCIAVIVVFGILWLYAFIRWLFKFFYERDYIVRHIRKSTDENEIAHWERKLHEFYLCSIPLIGRWFKDRRM